MDEWRQTHERDDGPTGQHQSPWWLTRGAIAFLGFVAIAGFFLLTEHTAHVLGILPYLLLLACPLLHFFMHGHHHGGHDSHGRHARRSDGGDDPAGGGER